MPESLTIRTPDDFHCHLRQEGMLRAVLPHTANVFGRALVMPNTKPGIFTGEDMCRYYAEVIAARPKGSVFEPLMTIKLRDTTTSDDIETAKQCGAIAAKLYPRGVTTNSDDGVDLREIENLYPVFSAMSELGMALCIHGEVPSDWQDGVRISAREREFEFIPILHTLAQRFPTLRIVFEHISIKEAARWIQDANHENIAATITVHHLLCTADDMMDEGLNPHLFCKPVLKDVDDRFALIQYAMSGSPRFFLGTDSAPHRRNTKECGRAAPGGFSAPGALPLLAELFEKHNALDRLENFTSRFGAEFYRLTPNKETVTLEREEWRVPMEYSSVSPEEEFGPDYGAPGIVPLWAGKTILWRVTAERF